MMPIISEGYASTKIQGGSGHKTRTEKPEVTVTTGTTTTEKPTLEMKANVIEQAQVQEISSTT